MMVSVSAIPLGSEGVACENAGITGVFTSATAWIDTPGALEWLAEEFTRALEEFTAQQTKRPQTRRKAG